ncbi:hypothetical protein [Pseudomonas tohonis]|uniref:hypothetical protein n=1 Tax=Pseudomonas tohonis TaxID=2725477 RepID=UPI001F188E9A|nr:hypothetical protein [Pseudomonas tohonis]
MSIERHEASQSSALAYTGNDARGVCLEACRRWVRAVPAPLRTAAQKALALLGWQEFEAHMPALVEDCRAAMQRWRP